MGDLIFKLSGPSRAIELQIPMSKSITELDMIKKALGKSGEDTASNTKKKKSKQDSKKGMDTSAKIGASTLGVLLASVILSAMKDD